MRYNPNGLTQEQVERSRAEKGENVLTPVKDNSAWKLFIEKFEDPIIQVLLFAAALFGMVFSVGWTPCVGAFLGSALMLASQQGHVLEGMAMLLCYSLGLGIPFLLSAVLIDKLRGTFNWIKAHYDLVNKICGAALVLVGVLMATGTLGRLLAILS